MNFEFTIKGDDKPFIEITDRELLSLQDLLNTINVYPDIHKVIQELKELRHLYPEYDELVESKYNGYWDDDDLGKCFSVLGFEYVYVFIDNKNSVFIENEYQYPEIPRVKLKVDEFIKILEDWRDILKPYFEKNV